MPKPCTCTPPNPRDCATCWHSMNTPFFQQLWGPGSESEPFVSPVMYQSGHVPRISDVPPVDFEQTKPTAICTIVGQCYGRKMWSISRGLMKAAAERWNSDLVILQPSGILPDTSPTFMFAEKFRIRDMLDDRWDRVAYIDVDVLISPDAPNIFDAVPGDKFGAVRERQHYWRMPDPLWYDREMNRMMASLGEDHSTDAPGDSFNAGVMVFSKQHLPVLSPPPGEIPDSHCWEQNWFNYQMWKHNVPVHYMGQKWNYMYWPHSNEYLKADGIDAHMLHFAGLVHRAERIKQMEVWAGRLMKDKVSVAGDCLKVM